MREVYEARAWRETVTLALCALVALLFAEFALGMHASDGNLQAVEILSLSVLGSNLAMGYAVSFDKASFLRGHAIELFALIPLFGLLRFAEYDYALVRLLRVGAHADWIGEGAGYALSAVRYRFG